MPLVFKQQISQNITLAVWQIAESEEFFFNSLRLLPEDEWRIKSIKLPAARLQKWACRATLANLLENNEISITYSETGQPLLSNHFVSFSHTKNFVAVAKGSVPMGIDMEEITPRILPLYRRFMSPQEIASCDINNLQELYYFWCAKEAMFKWFSKGNLDFIGDLKVNPSENKGVVCIKDTLTLVSTLLDNLMMVTAYK